MIHDIRTPLNGILGVLEMVKGMISKNEAQDFIDLAKKLCKMMLYVTYDIRDFYLIENNKFMEDLSVVNLKQLNHEVYGLVKFFINEKKLNFNILYGKNVPHQLSFDKERYTQILLNLIENAIKYTKKGSITVEINYNIKESELITSVTDTGLGIKSEDIPKLFILFGKLEKNIEKNMPGVGFGLVICKKLAEALGGTINVMCVWDCHQCF